MSLTIGAVFRRDELAEAVGAGGDGCFLSRDAKVVAIAMDPKKNPDAPDVLLVGRGPRKERNALRCLESEAGVPVFIKKASHQWMYVGRFRGESLDSEPAVIGHHAAKSGRGDIWGVLTLVPERI